VPVNLSPVLVKHRRVPANGGGGAAAENSAAACALAVKRGVAPELNGMAYAVDVAEGRVLVLLHHVTRPHLFVTKHFFPAAAKLRGAASEKDKKGGLADMLLMGCAGTPASFSSCTQC
jgi:hypothetical protein